MSDSDTILSATIALAQEVGWEKTTVREIAKRIGRSTMKIYSDFGSKDQLLLTLQRKGFQLLQHYYQLALTPEKSPQEKLLSLSLAHLRFAREHQLYYELMFSLNGVLCKADTRDVMQAASQPIRQVLQEAVGRADHVAFVNWWALVHGFTLVRTQAGLIEESTQDRMLTQLINQLAKGLC